MPDRGAVSDLSFRPLEPPSNEDIARLANRVARRLTKIALRYLAHGKDDYIYPGDEQAAPTRQPSQSETMLQGSAIVAIEGSTPIGSSSS